MNIGSVLAVAVGLGMDAMSVSMSIGVRWNGPRQKFRLAWHMGLFQFLMPIIGYLAGQKVAGLLAQFGKYAAAAMVAGIGVKMLYEALKSHPGGVAEHAEELVEEKIVHRHPKDPTRGWALVVMSVATSLDALVVGFSLGIGQTDGIFAAAGVIGVIAAAMSLIGVIIGQRAGEAFGRPAEIIGAIVLVGLGISFLFH